MNEHQEQDGDSEKCELWVCITTFGSQYEEQLEIYSNKRRYRPLKMELRQFEEKGIGEWKSGVPPNVAHEMDKK